MGLIWDGATAVLRPRDHLLIRVMARPSVTVSPRMGGGGPLGATGGHWVGHWGAAGGHWGPPRFLGAHLSFGGAPPLARPAPRNCVGHSSLCCLALPVTPLLPGGVASGWPAAGHRLASGCLGGLFGDLLSGNVGDQFRGDSCSERALAFVTGNATLRGRGRWRRRWGGRWRRRRRRGRGWRAGHSPRPRLFPPSSPFALLDLPLQLMFVI